MALNELLPREALGWAAQGQDEAHEGEGIYRYMDGAGELYRTYGYRAMLVRRYAKPGETDIVVELFDMAAAWAAFGVFSHTREGLPEAIGPDSEYRSGLLCFWKDRYFACVRAEKETPSSRDGALAIGRAILAAIPGSAPRPALLGHLPPDGLIIGQVRYFRHHTCLNYHYFVADENILRLGPDTEAALAAYREDKARTYLLLVRYPSAEAARTALDSFVRSYLPEAKPSLVTQTENGKWAAARAHREFVVIAFDAPTRARAEALIQAAQAKLEVKKP